MDEITDLTEILKYCPKGTKLYSSCFGEVEFQEVVKSDSYPIVVFTNSDLPDEEREQIQFTSDGKFWEEYEDAECVLFPSKDCRDWSKFSVPDAEKFDVGSLKPFDKVLVRFSEDNIWRCSIFSHLQDSVYRFACDACSYKECIPYNDETRHLVGTSNCAPKKYRIRK